MRIAAVSYMGDAAFGIAMLLALSHLARKGELPMTPWGFRAFSGPFERHAQKHFHILGWAFVGVCSLNVVSGVWLWQGRRGGAFLAFGMSPLTLALSGGFALPFLLAPVPIRTAVVLAATRRLTGNQPAVAVKA